MTVDSHTPFINGQTQLRAIETCIAMANSLNREAPVVSKGINPFGEHYSAVNLPGVVGPDFGPRRKGVWIVTDPQLDFAPFPKKAVGKESIDDRIPLTDEQREFVRGVLRMTPRRPTTIGPLLAIH